MPTPDPSAVLTPWQTYQSQVFETAYLVADVGTTLLVLGIGLAVFVGSAALGLALARR